MKKLRILGIAFFALIFLSASAFSAEVKIGYANLQKALNECDAGIKAKDALQDEAKKLENELNSKQEELKKLKDEIEKKGSVWNKDTKDAKERDLKAKSADFQKKYMEFGEELNKKKQERESQIIDDLREIVEEIAKKKGYTYVFERSVGGILYAPADADITTEVINTYNKRSKAK